MTQIKQKKMFFIDGFNLYHSIKRASQTDPKFLDCKWLNIEALCNRYIDTGNESFAGIKYFTALSWKPTSLLKQQSYIGALEAHCTNIEIVYGKFKERDKRCPICNKVYLTHEEKLTDVNLAISVFENAYINTFDIAVIVSADSDLIPPIRTIKRTFISKKIAILPPYGNSAIDLLSNAHIKYKMKANALMQSQLPDSVGLYTRPPEWKNAVKTVATV